MPHWLHKTYDVIGAIVILSSLAYSFLPSWESFSDYPSFQRWYRFLMIFVLKFGSFNYRNAVHPEIKATANVAGTPPN